MSMPYSGTLMLPLLASLLILPCTLATVWVKPYPICIGSPKWPTSQCDSNASTPSLPYVQGFEPDVFTQAAALGLNWTLGVDYYYVCSSFNEIMGAESGSKSGLGGALVNTSASRCFAGGSGITISETRIENGIQFSFPHLYTSIGILVKLSITSENNIWSFFFPFTTELWIAIGCTGLCFPLLIMFVTAIYWSGSTADSRQTVIGTWTFFSHLWFQSLAALMQPGPPDMGWSFDKKEAVDKRTGALNSDRDRHVPMPVYLLLLSFGFFTLIISSTYLANLAAFLTSKSSNSGYQSLNDLAGLLVGTSLLYSDGTLSLAKSGVVPTALPALTEGTALNIWLPSLRDGTFQALMTDETLIDQLYFNTSMYKTCDLIKLPQTVGVVNLGVAFHTDAPRSHIDGFNSGLVQMLDTGALEDTRKKWFEPGGSSCPQRTLTPSTSIGLDNMWGLWIIVAAAFGTSLLLSLVICVMRRQKRQGGPFLAIFTQDELLLYGSHIESEVAEAITQEKSIAIGSDKSSKDKDLMSALSNLSVRLDHVDRHVKGLSKSIEGPSAGT